MSKDNHPERDVEYIDRVLKFAQEIETFLEIDPGMNDPRTLPAISKSFEEIGEISNKITPALKEAEPGVHWKKMIGMRNFLSHKYGDAEQDVLTDTARRDLPVLKDALHRMRNRIA